MKRRTISQEELEVLLRKHKLWLENKDGGERANLTGADLKWANLTDADLTGADLKWANLKWANLTDADLTGANLTGANLTGADLKWANLTDADLTGADLKWANLKWANLTDADLTGANLKWANLTGANLTGADLKWANLTDADLTGADLDYSCLPLWCGSLKANFDDRQIIQIAYHIVKAGLNSPNTTEEVKTELTKIIDLANKFHRVKECGEIKKENCNES